MRTTDNQPEGFEQRILLTLMGHSPAIITETLYALSQQTPPYLPTEIHVITTLSGKEKLQSSLLGQDGALWRLCADYALPPPLIPDEHIHVITHNGRELPDIQTEEDNTATADFITALVHDLTDKANASLHVSIAGGRKTMTYYLGYALSLFGRMQDRMSHVLVDESRISRDFFYPAHDSDITVTLADIPFVRLREGLGFAKALSEGRYTFNRAVALVQQQFSGESVALVNNQLYANHIKVEHTKFKATSLAVYVWLLLRHRDGMSDIRYKSKDDSGNLSYSKELMAVYRQLHGEKGINKMENAIEDTGLTADYLRPHITACNTALEHSLNRAAIHYLIQRTDGGNGDITYHLPVTLASENIHLPLPVDFLASL